MQLDDIESVSSNETQPSPLLVGSILNNKYRVDSFLGGGGMGRVYFATNRELPDIQYAIKVLNCELTSNPRFRNDFFNEAKRQAQLKHPNIVKVVDYFVERGDYFLVLEYIHGQSLNNKIHDQGKLTEKETFSVIKDMLKALNYAHENSVVHLDVKPPNILIDKQCARLADFGISRGGMGISPTSPRGWAGTPEYMSPEQYLTPDKVDHRADVYAIGIVMFEMLTGKLPFSGQTAEEILQQQVHTPAPDLHIIEPKISKSLSRIVLKALAKNPAERYQGCMEFLKAIESYEQLIQIRKLLTIAVPIALGIGAGIYSLLAPPPDIRTSTKQALLSYETVCRDFKRRNDKKEALDITLAFGKAPDKVEEQIKDLDGNVSRNAVTYGTVLKELSHHEKREIEQTLALITATDNYEKKFANLIFHDYLNYQLDARSLSVNELIARCPSQE